MLGFSKLSGWYYQMRSAKRLVEQLSKGLDEKGSLSSYYLALTFRKTKTDQGLLIAYNWHSKTFGLFLMHATQ